MDRFTWHSHTVLTTSRPASRGAPEDVQGGAPATAASAAKRLLRHPGPQHEVRNVRTAAPAPSQQQVDRAEGQAQRVVSVLLRELDAARKGAKAAQAELAAVKEEYLLTLRGHKQGAADSAPSSSRTGHKDSLAAVGAGTAAARRKSTGGAICGGAADAAVPTSTHIRAFRPPGQAPPPRQLAGCQGRPPQQQQVAQRPARHEVPAAAALSWEVPPLPPQQHQQEQQHSDDGQIQVLQQDNLEMRSHLEALYAHCRHLQRQLDAAGSAATAAAAVAPAPRQPQSLTRWHVPAAQTVAAAALGSEPLLSPRRPASSPGRTAVVMSSSKPDGAGADLAAAVFEPAPEDVEELRLALNRTQRQSLKLSSKLGRAHSELADKNAEVRRWQEAVEQQAGTISSLRVDLESERRRQRDLEQALAAAQGAQKAVGQEVAALLGQLQAAEAAAGAAEDEAAALRGRLAAVEEQLGLAVKEAERLREEASSTNARLGATDLVRRDAERERDELEREVVQLRAALADAQAKGGAVEEELEAKLASVEQQVATEQQRSDLLQAQLSLAEAHGRDTERILTAQLHAVQEERNACLAAATRADALLVKLGQHAMATRGADCD